MLIKNLLLVMTLTIFSNSVNADPRIQECKKNITTPYGKIFKCVISELNEDGVWTRRLEKKPSFGHTFPPNSERTCDFAFWNHNGVSYEKPGLPATIVIDGKSNHNLTAWYSCTGGGPCREGDPHCGRGGVNFKAIDLENDKVIRSAFIGSIIPPEELFHCNLQSPCKTAPSKNIVSATAKRSVEGHQFVKWLGMSNGEQTVSVNAQTGGFLALYKSENRIANLCDNGIVRGLICDLGNFGDGGISVGRGVAMDIKEICKYVSGGGGASVCPGCGSFGLCANMTFTTARPTESFKFSVFENSTGKLISQSKVDNKNTISASFVPKADEHGSINDYTFVFESSETIPPEVLYDLPFKLDTSASKRK